MSLGCDSSWNTLVFQALPKKRIMRLLLVSASFMFVLFYFLEDSEVNVTFCAKEPTPLRRLWLCKVTLASYSPLASSLKFKKEYCPTSPATWVQSSTRGDTAYLLGRQPVPQLSQAGGSHQDPRVKGVRCILIPPTPGQHMGTERKYTDTYASV